LNENPNPLRILYRLHPSSRIFTVTEEKAIEHLEHLVRLSKNSATLLYLGAVWQGNYLLQQLRMKLTDFIQKHPERFSIDQGNKYLILSV
jgi:hypothetical protein